MALPLVKVLPFALSETLRIGSSIGTNIKAEDNFGLLPHLYSLRDDTSFHHKLKERQTKEVKSDDTEVETGIWDNAVARVMG